MAQQARNMCMFFQDQPEPARYLGCDNNTKFTRQFCDILQSEGLEVIQPAVRAPNQKARAERFVQTIKEECLEWFIALGEKHLRHVINEYVAHSNQERPHLATGNLPPRTGQPPDQTKRLGPEDVVVRERLGGLLRHYQRQAA